MTRRPSTSLLLEIELEKLQFVSVAFMLLLLVVFNAVPIRIAFPEARYVALQGGMRAQVILNVVLTARRHPLTLEHVMVSYELPVTTQHLLSMVAPHVLFIRKILNRVQTAKRHLLILAPVMVAYGQLHFSQKLHGMVVLRVQAKP
jgi:hypothetical protein